jgi:hypothetical protein
METFWGTLQVIDDVNSYDHIGGVRCALRLLLLYILSDYERAKPKLGKAGSPFGGGLGHHKFKQRDVEAHKPEKIFLGFH